jgi:hypothetical protein
VNHKIPYPQNDLDILETHLFESLMDRQQKSVFSNPDLKFSYPMRLAQRKHNSVMVII